VAEEEVDGAADHDIKLAARRRRRWQWKRRGSIGQDDGRSGGDG